MALTVFQILNKISINNLEIKLKKCKPQIDKKVNHLTGDYVDLKITIEDIKNKNKQIQGLMKYDYLDMFKDRSGDNFQLRTKYVDFTFLCGSGLYVIVHSGVSESRVVKQNFARLVFLTQPPSILSCDITPPKMKDFLDANPHSMFSCTWDGLDIPRLTGTNLKGGEIDATDDFKRYDKHGMKKSIMFNLSTENITLSINRGASVHFYSKLSRDQQEEFMRSKILPLCR